MDEFQDTNPLQMALLALLAPAEPGRVTAVGDDDQCIYAFQGAQGAAALRAFLAAFPRAERVTLEQNYRSSGTLVAAAAAVAACNRRRCAKRAFTSNGAGEKAQLVEFPIPPHISTYLPMSPHISPYLPISPARRCSSSSAPLCEERRSTSCGRRD